jgi:hypothetical protein
VRFTSEASSASATAWIRFLRRAVFPIGSGRAGDRLGCQVTCPGAQISEREIRKNLTYMRIVAGRPTMRIVSRVAGGFTFVHHGTITSGPFRSRGASRVCGDGDGSRRSSWSSVSAWPLGNAAPFAWIAAQRTLCARIP